MQKARWSLVPSDQRSPSLKKCQSTSLAEVTSILDNRAISKVLCPHSLIPSQNVILKTGPSLAVHDASPYREAVLFLLLLKT